MFNNDLFKNVALPVALPAAVVKANKLAVANTEKLVAFQMGVLRAYVDLGLSRLKAASEVSDLKGLQAFYADQVELAKVVSQKLVADSKALTELGAGFKADFDALSKDFAAELAPVVAKPVRKAA